MICPVCNKNGRFKTVDSRPRDWGVKRVKVCPNCKTHVPTVEIYEFNDEIKQSLELSQYLIEYRKKENKWKDC